jgi:serralysin
MIMDKTQLDAQYEIFSKGLFAYFSANGQYQPLLNKLFDDLGYAIDKVIDNPATGLQAIGLRSKDGKKSPVLIYQGSNGEVQDGNAIAGPSGGGFSQFSANKQEIKDWLVAITNDRQSNPQGLKPDVSGVSLGGSLTQITASEFPTLIDSAISFISPGINQETADKFIENGGNPDRVRHYIRDGDLTSLLGETFIPGKVVVSDSDISENDQANYINLKHLAGILADFQSIITKTGDPAIDEALAISNKPNSQTFTEISVDELNRPDFTFQGKDWLAVLEKVRTNNPNLAKLIADRQSFEEVRYVGKLGTAQKLVEQAIKGENPVTSDRVNQPTPSDDILFGTNRRDLISGLAGDDYIRGNAGNDKLYGNEGNDALIGGMGNDILTGGSGNDVLTGNSGKDRFIFGDTTPFQTAALGIDNINDFVPGEDLIGLSKATFTNVSKNFSRVFATVTDDAAAEISQASIIYNTNNGKLFYNTNGIDAGFGEGGQFANIFGQPALSAENFILV